MDSEAETEKLHCWLQDQYCHKNCTAWSGQECRVLRSLEQTAIRLLQINFTVKRMDMLEKTVELLEQIMWKLDTVALALEVLADKASKTR